MTKKINSLSEEKNPVTRAIIFILLVVLCCAVLFPVLLVLVNSFKSQFFISKFPFKIPTVENEIFVGWENYINGIRKTGFWKAFGYSLFITVFSVSIIIIFTSMTGWYITRVKSKVTKIIYYALVFSMIVPFQMVMFTMSKIANMLYLDNPIGIIFIYLGFGAGLSTFMFSGFVKSVPKDIEEAALIDGCTPIKTFFSVVFPILKPTTVTVAILNTMWIWNDYLLPYLLLGTEYKTIPIAVQYLRGGYGSIDWGSMMAVLVLAIIPVIIFYLSCQKQIIKGVTAGAVKG